MKVICLSDTHGCHSKLSIPTGDIVIHAGDFCDSGKKEEARDFMRWYSSLPHQYKIFIAGNHDFYMELPDRKELLREYRDLIYLEDSGIEVGGIKIWGSPFQPVFFDWAFNRKPVDLERHWNKIPPRTDILVTHCPPSGVLDRNMKGMNCGCPLLSKRIEKIMPRFHVFGHIHEAAGTIFKKINYINCSILNHKYRMTNEPIEFETTRVKNE